MGESDHKMERIFWADYDLPVSSLNEHPFRVGPVVDCYETAGDEGIIEDSGSTSDGKSTTQTPSEESVTNSHQSPRLEMFQVPSTC